MFTIYGGAGFVGNHLAEYLRGRGEEVYVPLRDSDPASEDKNLGHIIYCIGLTADFRRRSLDTVEAHVGRLVDVLANTTYESFLYLSSTRLYFEAESGDEKTNFLVNPHDPLQIFSLTKLAGESACLSLDNPKVRIARLSNVYGVDVESENFLTAIIREALVDGKIHLQTARQSEKDYINVDSVVEALVGIACRGREQVYNVAGGLNINHGQIVDLIARETGCALSVAENAETVSFPPLSIDRISGEFDYKPQKLLDDLPKLIEAYRQKL